MASQKRQRGDSITGSDINPAALDADDIEKMADVFEESQRAIIELLVCSKDSAERKTRLTGHVTSMRHMFDLLARSATVLLAERRSTADIERLESAITSVSEKLDRMNSTAATETATYASAIGRKPSEKVRIPSGKSVAPRPRSTIYIRPSEGNSEIKSSADTRAAVTGILKPNELGLKVDRLVLAGRSAVMVQSTSDDLSRLPREKLEQAGLTVQPNNKLRPRLAIYGVPAELSAEEVKAALLAQNFDGETRNHVEKDLQVLFKFGKRDQKSVHWIVETSAENRKLVVDKERLYIDWYSCRVHDHVRVVRCYRCQKFGHLSKDCRSEIQCGHCAGSHESRDCPNKGATPKCANCTRYGHSGTVTEHEAASLRCPAYQRRVQSKIQDIDYGQ